jgi:xanthine dehydrogenase accessory factor
LVDRLEFDLLIATLLSIPCEVRDMSLPGETDPTPSAETVAKALSWRDGGQGVALATVTRTWGSSPCPTGSHLAVRADSSFEGSVSGGCIEGEVVTASLKAIRDGGLANLEFGVADEDAWAVGLACGGRVAVFVAAVDEARARVLAALEEARAKHIPSALLIDTETGEHALWQNGRVVAGDIELSAAQTDDLAERFVSDQSGVLDDEAARPVFARVYNPQLRLLIVGAVHIAQRLAEIGASVGYDVTVVDPRDTWGTSARFPGIRLDRRWPSTALEDLKPDARTAIVTLSHDPKLDDPALLAALASDAFYIGSLGSRRTHAKRLERLRAAGVTEESLARIHAPVGLDIGAETPAEIALAALAEITTALRRPEKAA